MTEPILDTEYWKRRLEVAEKAGNLHLAIFKCPQDRWYRIEDKHRAILRRTIDARDSILDVGCAWGRLLTLLPEGWYGKYLGVDVSPDFVGMARDRYPNKDFIVSDIRAIPEQYEGPKFDWAVLVSIRPMIIRDLGNEVWEEVLRALRCVAERVLYLEYDEHDEGHWDDL